MHVRIVRRATAAAVAGVLSLTPAWAGPYSGPNQTTPGIDPAIPAASPLFVEWADAILPLGAGTSFAPRGSTAVSATGFNSLGDLDATEIANGVAPGFLTVTFPTGIRNGAGADFAVFENGFTFGTTPAGGPGLFAEFAFVEVSSNGTDFARFPAISTNTGPLPGGFGTNFVGFDVTNVYNLAGKHAAGFGTPFDLDDLLTDALVIAGTLDLDDIQYVRLVDIPGNGAFTDSLGNPIFDNWLTTGTGGFDFRLPAGQGVGVINVVPEPALGVVALAGVALLRRRRRWVLAAAAATVATSASATLTVDFDELDPAQRPAYDPANPGFTSQGVTFGGGFFSGWTYSNVNDTTTAGFTNQYAAFTGTDASGSGNYAIGYPTAIIDLPAGLTPASVAVTNTTYAALSMLQGDAFSKQFGGPTGNDPDFFRVTFTGFDALGGSGTTTGSTTFTLADYTFADNTLDYVVDTWTLVDLTALGAARSIGISFASSDVGTFGINTPVYVAIDDLTLVPEPAAAATAALLAAGLLRRRRA